MTRDEFYNNLELYHSKKHSSVMGVKNRKPLFNDANTNALHPNNFNDRFTRKNDNKIIAPPKTSAAPEKTPAKNDRVGFVTDITPTARAKVRAVTAVLDKAGNDLSKISRNDALLILDALNELGYIK